MSTAGSLAVPRASTDTPAASRFMVRAGFAAILLLGVLLPLAIAGASGSLLIPHNDDFSYRDAALGLFQSGQINLTGWGVMTLVGQLLWVQPFLALTGGSESSFGVANAILAVVAVSAAFALARSVLPVGRALLATALLVAVPGFALTATSFMTDVPTLATELVCLLFGLRGLARSDQTRWRWLVASLVVGVVGFSVREFAVAAPAAVLAVGIASDWTNRRRYVLAGIALAGVCAAIWVWTAALPGQGEQRLAFLGPDRVPGLMQFGSTLALALAPAIAWRVIAAPIGRLRDVAIGVAVSVIVYHDAIAQFVSGDTPAMFVGNILDADGALGQAVLAGVRPALFDPTAWYVLNGVALVAVVAACGVLGGAAGQAIRSRPSPSAILTLASTPLGLLVVFVGVYGVGLMAYGSAAPLWDRYLYPLVVPLATILLSGERVRRALPAAAAVVTGLGGLALVASMTFVNSTAFDVARWRMAEDAVAFGVRPELLDGGLEWVGSHVSPPFLLYPVSLNAETWYVGSFPLLRPCAFVSSSPVDDAGFSLSASDLDAYQLDLFAGSTEPLYLYRSSAPGCG
jgi:hypothetical protein